MNFLASTFGKSLSSETELASKCALFNTYRKAYFVLMYLKDPISLFFLTLSFLNVPLHSSHVSHSLVPLLLLFPFLLSLPFCHRQVGTSLLTDVLTFSSAFFLSGLGVFPFIPGDSFSAGTRDIPRSPAPGLWGPEESADALWQTEMREKGNVRLPTQLNWAECGHILMRGV